MLYLYSVNLKKMFLSGNILVSVLSAFVIMLVWLFNKNIPVVFAIAYSAFAFMSSLIREIIKDAEDIEGDRNYNCRTLPIVLGIEKTKQILVYLNSIFIALLFGYGIYIFGSDEIHSANSKFIYLIYILVALIIPIIAMGFMITISKQKKDFSKLSSVIKFIMIAGILSMLLLKI